MWRRKAEPCLTELQVNGKEYHKKSVGGLGEETPWQLLKNYSPVDEGLAFDSHSFLGHKSPLQDPRHHLEGL